MGENVQPWDADKAKTMKWQAVQLMRSHGHEFIYSPKIDRDRFLAEFDDGSDNADEEIMTRDNCGACALAGWGEHSENGPLEPNYGNWARVYVEAGAAIPTKYREAFEAARRGDNLRYAEGLERDIVTFGLHWEQ